MTDIFEKKNLWLSIYHPGEIINAVGLALLYGDRYKINLLIKDHPYWQKVKDEFYKKYFDNIYHFPDIGFSKHFLREVVKIIKTRKMLKELLIKNDDLYITLSNKTFVDNIFLSIYPDHQIIKFSSRSNCEDSLKDYLKKNTNYKEILTSKIWNVSIIPFFNLLPVVYLKNKLDKGLYEIVYKEGDHKIFYKFFYFVGYNNFNLGADEVYNFLPFLGERLAVQTKTSDHKIIIFFGEGRDHFDNYHCAFTSQCLRYIEKYFPGYHYLYKPHPIDRDGYEKNNIELGKFVVCEEGGISELLLLELLSEVGYCFSISSTSLRRALDLGIQSYYFIKLDTQYSDEYIKLMLKFTDNAPNEVFMTDFNVAPHDYKVSVDNLQKFYNEINKLNFD